MPVVLRERGFSFYIYFEDHTPPHVHAIKGGQEVVINIGDDEIEPSVREIKGMPPKDIKRALAIVLLNQEDLLDYWEEIANA